MYNRDTWRHYIITHPPPHKSLTNMKTEKKKKKNKKYLAESDGARRGRSLWRDPSVSAAEPLATRP